MDKSVIDAMVRWPQVPDVFGWLSLNGQGNWRLHSQGEALRAPEQAGEAITSQPILQFIGRNYAADARGQWYFQNGPQRVYVRLDAAPFVLHALTTPENPFQLLTHTGVDVSAVRAWLLASDGRLYAQTAHGPGLIQGRDLEAVLSRLQTIDGASALDILADDTERQAPFEVMPLTAPCAGEPRKAITFGFSAAEDIPATMGFVRMPEPETS